MGSFFRLISKTQFTRIFLPELLFVFFLNSIANHAHAIETLKIAIIDNLKYEKFSTEIYQQDYFKGIAAGEALFSLQGIQTEIKHFNFDKKPLAVIQAAKEARKWNPDVVIGPRSSDLFLLLKPEFENILVVSPLASASAVFEMGDNFYSISPPNETYAKAMINFVKKYYPARNIQPIIEADCKSCVDWNEQFRKVFKSSKPGVILKDANFFLSAEVETIPVENLIKGSNIKSLFLIPNKAFTSGTLMGRISNYFKSNETVFIGADGWGERRTGHAGKYQTPYSYKGYYLNPFSIEKTDPEVQEFLSHIQSTDNKTPAATISLITYKTMTAIEISYRVGMKKQTAKERILSGFKKQTKEDKEIFRPKKFGVFEIDQTGERFKEFVQLN